MQVCGLFLLSKIQMDYGRRVKIMSNEISLFEKLGGTYTEVDGILYPNIGMDDTDTKSDTASVVAGSRRYRKIRSSVDLLYEGKPP